MLVDLGRNDIGKISRVRNRGSREIHGAFERFSHVMHIGSTVNRNHQERIWMPSMRWMPFCRLELLSGAPKIRACEIINELENNKRGVYGGAIGYLDFTGNLDTCIAIRMAYKKEWQGICQKRCRHRGRQRAGERISRNVSTRQRQ